MILGKFKSVANPLAEPTGNNKTTSSFDKASATNFIVPSPPI
jgi:hypothetical protein